MTVPWFVTTLIISPGCNLPSDQKTAGSPPTRSTCPAITALPVCPGAAPTSYQKTLLQYGELYAFDTGASITPVDVCPTPITGASILMAGICKRAGAHGASTGVPLLTPWVKL